MNLYFFETGVLLNEQHPQYKDYNGVWNNAYSYYNEDWGLKRTEEEAINIVKKKAKSSRKEFYGVVAKITGFNDDLTDEQIDEIEVPDEDFVPEKVVYSVHKQEKDGTYKEGFVEAAIKKEAVRETEKASDIAVNEREIYETKKENHLYRICFIGENGEEMVFDQLAEESLRSVLANLKKIVPEDGIIRTEKYNPANDSWDKTDEEEVYKKDCRNDVELNRKYWDEIDEKIYVLIADIAKRSVRPIDKKKLEAVIWDMVAECRDMLIDSFELNLAGSYPVIDAACENQETTPMR